MAVSNISVGGQDTVLYLKFNFTPKWQALTPEKFQLWTTGATPAQIANPWKDFDLQKDYNSISRSLKLYVNTQLEPNTLYEIHTVGVPNAAGVIQDNDIDQFTTGDLPLLPQEPDAPAIEIVDHSIKTDSLGVTVIGGQVVPVSVAQSFRIVSTDPEEDAIYLPEDFNKGRVSINFSQVPSAPYITPAYFKAQKKALSRKYARWETVDALVTTDGGTTVYVDFPSDDAEPVYNEPDASYFATNHKYRVRVSKAVGSS